MYLNYNENFLSANARQGKQKLLIINFRSQDPAVMTKNPEEQYITVTTLKLCSGKLKMETRLSKGG